MKPLRKTMIVSLNFVAGAAVNSFITVDFIPDEIIVRGIGVFSTGSTDTNFILASNLIIDTNIAALPTETDVGDYRDFIQMDLVFNNLLPISGTYKFSAFNPTTGTVANITAIVCVHFEFIKY